MDNLQNSQYCVIVIEPMKWLIVLVGVAILGWLLSAFLDYSSFSSSRIGTVRESEARLLRSATNADFSNR